MCTPNTLKDCQNAPILFLYFSYFLFRPPLNFIMRKHQLNMNRDFSRATVVRIPRKNSLKRKLPKQSSQSKSARFTNVSINRSASIANKTKVLSDLQQNQIDHEGQKNSTSAQKEKETNQLNLSDCAQDSLRINSITNSTTCFDLSKTHRSLNRNHRISPINCHPISTDDFTLDIFERYIE